MRRQVASPGITEEDLSMIVSNGIKKLSKYGQVQHDKTGKYWIVKGRYEVSFRANGEDRPDQDIVCEHTQRVNEVEDSQSDYFPGSYWPNLTQALRYAER